MDITIKGVSKEAFARLMDELRPKSWFKLFYDDQEGDMCVTLSEGVMLKTHFNDITLDCGGVLASLEANEFVEVTII